ncbi:galactose-1-epimerase [Iocasia frigidifontis]|uniref:Aldose 1-epimerase n=1 Tax=Iocasia fonsfrigidae TaxID=2682810 RepID=A0A8A7KCL5_9FIRM|nr:aldose epimerase family protein [Iocasia fonsfrigidae]QTL97348.1 galactose-1-epimerase [Iocasia fonsfrigidae]
MEGNKDICSNVSIKPFGILKDGKEVFLYRLSNENGVQLEVINYGGIIKSLFVPDARGKFSDIVLGYNRLADYEKDPAHFGAVVGRYGNRIAGGEFVLDNKKYSLALNNQPGGKACHLHGGERGFDKIVWDAEPIIHDNAAGLRLHYLSRDGEEGYPGNLDVNINYLLTNENTLRIEYQGETDQATPINLTQHSYFNLKGEGEGDILGHFAYINADNYTPVDEGLIPTGEIAGVSDTPFDFRKTKKIVEDINQADQQLEYGGGYDHNYVLNGESGELTIAAQVYDEESRRQLEVWTTEPGMQFYTGNALDGSLVGKKGKAYQKNSGFCLETQHYPDSPNQDNFPDTILRPGEKYQTITEFRFSIR